MGHFRAHARRALRLPVSLEGRSGAVRQAVVIDLSLAGAGLEAEDALVPGDRLAITFATPTMWDPLVVEAVVAWSHPPRPAGVDALRRQRTIARAGVVFDHASPEDVLAMFEMLATLGYE